MTDTTIPFGQAELKSELKSRLDLAWEKIESGSLQERVGRNLWVEGTVDVICVLHEARLRLASDKEFGKWLADSGYGEHRISRQDRAALLNMAINLDVTRRVLWETRRRSYRHIWTEEIQPRLPRLPHVGQPPVSRRPKTNTRPQTADNQSQAKPNQDTSGEDMRAEAEAAARERAAQAEAERTKYEREKREREKARAERRRRAREQEWEYLGRLIDERTKKPEIPSSLRTLLVKTLGMLGSEHENEALVAARKVEEIRRKLGLMWDDLIVEATQENNRKPGEKNQASSRH
jgi:hypothetical protein